MQANLLNLVSVRILMSRPVTAGGAKSCIDMDDLKGTAKRDTELQRSA